MSESAGKYLIKFSTVHDGSGAKEAIKDVKELGAEAEKAGERWGKTVAGKLGISRDEMKELREVMGGAGVGEFANLGKMTGAFAVSQLAVQEWSAALEEWIKLGARMDEQLKKLIDDADQYAEAQRQAAETIQTKTIAAASDLARWLSHLQDSYDALSVKMKENIALAQFQSQAIQGAASDTDALTAAQVRYQEALGMTSPVVGNARIAAAKLEDERKKADAADKATAAEEAAKMKRAAEAHGEVTKAQGDLGKDVQDQKLNIAEQGTAQKQLDQTKKERDAAQKDADAAGAKWKFIQDNGIVMYNTMHPSDMTTTAKAKGDAEWTDKQLRAKESAMEAAQANLDRYIEEGKTIDDLIASAKRLIDERGKLAQQLEDEAKESLARRMAVGDQNDAHFKAQEEINAKTRRTEEVQSGQYGTVTERGVTRYTLQSQEDFDLSKLEVARQLVAQGRDPYGRAQAMINQLLADLVRITNENKARHELTATDIADLQSQLNTR